ncbi:thiamine pyrophosphate-binding protein [Rubrobacter taiwanensis]|jgi:thiamine pyrophosphate-dependent acetolactate synthase large subunit-like protein|uniref:Thiamine pyrophosphate-binding protein n=1 Tax=Rubrobacter taiwanensis TaxID=185139 RepID=A0A4R1B8W4_9ACTN|nr:thiamine pyrophosphate-binding protein [Rubrobacter taiwanensis]TCJ12709.1 thiamine pyrophosphate-binding protein [Rubrobacter taiwanensis]
MRVYEAVGETLKRLGVNVAFGLVGSGNFKLVDYMTRCCGIRYYGARHEGAAIGMADGYARVSGKLGVCTVHQGPGVTNTLTALTEAVKSRTPLLLLAGDTATGALYHNLDVDQGGIVSSVGAGVERIRSADKTIEDINRAVHRARIERRPIIASLPIDFQEYDCDIEDPAPFVASAMLNPRPSEEAVSAMADMLEIARRPVIIAGRGAVLADARAQLEELGNRVGALFATSAAAKGFFAGSPFDLGIAGGFASSLAVQLFSEADLVLSFGASLNRWTMKHGNLFPSSAQIIHCDVEPTSIGRVQPVTLGVVGDATETAEALLRELDRRNIKSDGFRTEPVVQRIKGFRWKNDFEEKSDEGTVDPRFISLALDEILPEERTVVVDGGHFMEFPTRYLSVPDAAGFVPTWAFQSIGLGMGIGMGAAVARTDRLALVVIGDGGLLMTLGEIDAAIHLGIPLLIVVMNDAGYGAEVHHFRSLGLPTDIVRFKGSDFAAIATAMGARGMLVRKLDELEQLKSWLAAPEGVMVVDCKVNPEVEGDFLEEAFAAEV